MTLPTLTIAEAVALLVWMAQDRGRDAGDRMLESAKRCAGGQRAGIHRYHPRGTFFGGAKGPPAETLKSGQVVPLYPKKRKAKRAEQKR